MFFFTMDDNKYYIRKTEDNKYMLCKPDIHKENGDFHSIGKKYGHREFKDFVIQQIRQKSCPEFKYESEKVKNELESILD